MSELVVVGCAAVRPGSVGAVLPARPWSANSAVWFCLPVLCRLKMGLCSGVPNNIEPDHLGRADYHGASINQAARFMDAAAHGGQVCGVDNNPADTLWAGAQSWAWC